MTINRDYQTQLIQAARLKLRAIQARLTEQGITRKPRLMVQLPCGGGKTRVAGMIAKTVIERGGRVMFLAHRGFLMDQTSLTFKEMGIAHSFIAAGKPFNPGAKCHVGMVGSVKSRAPKLKHKPTLIALDEGHHGVAAVWRWISDNFPDATILYLSATPGLRTDGVGLEEVCDDIVLGPQVQELVDLGALSGVRWMRGEPPPELRKVKKRAGDFAPDQQGAIMSRPVIVGNVVENYIKNAMGKKAIYFFPDIATSKTYAAEFVARGVPMAHLDKDTPQHERKRIARDIATGKLMGFCNAFIAGEGFDLAAQAGMDVTIEVVGLCRLTASFPLLVQMAMRSMRPKADGSAGIVYDHCDNHMQHDEWLPIDDIEWSLSGEARKPKTVKAVQCPHCLATDYPEKNLCKHCGKSVLETVRAIAERARMEVVEGELKEVEQRERVATEAAEKHRKKLEEWSCKTYADWLALGQRRRYQNPEVWAGMRYNLKQRKRA